MHEITVAIDGPAASGKSTVGAALAERLGYTYFDSGVMYRAVTWAALDRGVPIGDASAVTRLAEELLIEVGPPSKDDGRQYSVYADGKDITWQIRTPPVNRAVSPVSACAGVRAALLHQQRRIGAEGGVIMVGRDIGTVVMPDAAVKIYLDAALEERTRRRLGEMQERGAVTDRSEVRASLERRDRIDSSRDAAPLKPAEDASVVDSTHMTVEEVVCRVEAIVREAIRRCAQHHA